MSPLLSIVLRVVVLSSVLSCAIKFGAPQLAIPANTITATVGVFLPVVLVALTLGWRQLQIASSHE